MLFAVERMTKVDFDGFILLLERMNWNAFPLENNPEGWQAAAEWSVIHKLRSDTDYARVYDMYDRYRSMRKFSELAQRYKDELIAFREQCYGASKAQTFLSVIVAIPSSVKASPMALIAEKHESAKPARKKATKKPKEFKPEAVKKAMADKVKAAFGDEIVPTVSKKNEAPAPSNLPGTGTVLQHDKVENGATYPDIWDAKIGEFDFNSRARRALMGLGIEYIAELISRSEDQLSGVLHLGKATLENIKYALGQHDLKLGTYVNDWKTPVAS